MTDDMNATIRRLAGHGPAEVEPDQETQTPSFDGGARTPAPPAPPTMGETIRAALTAKHHLTPADAMRQVQSDRHRGDSQ